MAEIALDRIGAKLSEVLDEMRNMRTELSAMRAEIDGGFHMMRGTDDRVEGLRRIVDAHGQRITALEKISKP
jgi:hypothetical protein